MIFFTGVSPNSSKRTVWSCWGELTLNSCPATFWISSSSAATSSVNSFVDRAQQLHVDANTARLHQPEHHHQRQFDLLVDEVQLPVGDLGAQVFAKSRDQGHFVGQRLVTGRRVEERRRGVDDRFAEKALRDFSEVVAATSWRRAGTP